MGAILARKEIERYANDGTFLWGVGNSIIPSLRDFLTVTDKPKVVFSPIRSRTRPVDEAADAVAVWTRARTPRGTPWTLPPHSMVTSHTGRVLGRHFALVCHSSLALRLVEDGPPLAMGDVCNLRSGRPIGASQVTAIVRHRPSDGAPEEDGQRGPVYTAAMIVDLVPPYVAVLEAPKIVRAAGRLGDDLINACWNTRSSQADWMDSAHQYDLFK